MKGIKMFGKKKSNNKKQKEYCSSVSVGEVYHADNRDLNIWNENGKIRRGSHDVIVVSVNKRKNTCKVKTITSLERKYDGKNVFIEKKLPNVRNGKILVIPIKDIHTKHLSGIYHDEKEIKVDKLYKSNSGVVFPRRYKYLVYKK